jgi:predicted RNase H-like HicB family nuclease
MKRHYNIIIEQDEDGYYVGFVPELPRMSRTGEKP